MNAAAPRPVHRHGTFSPIAAGIVLAAGIVPAMCPARGAIAGDIRSPGLPRVGLFGLEEDGRRIVYVLDRSASMGDGEASPLAASKREVLRSIEALSDVQQFHLVFYNHRPRRFTPAAGAGRLVFANAENRREAGAFVESIRPDGGTDHAEAIRAAIRLGPDLIFMVTDGDAQDDLPEEDLDRLERLLGGTRLVLIQFVSAGQFAADGGGGSPRLAELARRSGGSSKTLEPAVEKSGRGSPP